MEMLSIIETGGAIALTIGILEGLKQMNIVATKYIPIIGLIVGIVICGLGSVAGVLPITDWANVVWYGIMTGLMSCGLFSGVKNAVK